MKIQSDCVVCIDYTIFLPDGQVVETSVGSEPLTYLQGRRQIVPGVEHALIGYFPGSRVEVTVPPEDGYGLRDSAGIFAIPRSLFPIHETLEEGAVFSGQKPDGQCITLRVIDANHSRVVVDINHPLAGQTLRVSIAVRSVRWASDEELCAGCPSERPTAVPQYLC